MKVRKLHPRAAPWLGAMHGFSDVHGTFTPPGSAEGNVGVLD